MAETGRLVGLVVTLVAATVVIVGVAVPIIDEVTTDITTQTYENTDYEYRMSVLTGTEWSIEYDGTAWIADGEEIDLSSYDSYYWVVSDNLILRINSSSSQLTTFVPVGDGTLTRINIGMSSVGYGIWFHSDGTAEVVYSGGTLTVTYTSVLVPDDDGDYALYISQAHWTDDDATVYAWQNSIFYATGTIADGLTVTASTLDSEVWYDTSATASASVVAIKSGDSPARTYWSTIQLNNSYDGSSARYSMIAAPLTYHVVESTTVTELAQIIPLLLVLMILVTGAYAVIRSTQE